MQQLVREAVFILGVALDQSAQRRAGNDSHVAAECALVFLVCHQRVNFSATHQCDMAGLASAEVFLQENSFGIINVLEPGARVRERLA